MLELFTKKPIFQGNDEIHQLDVIYRIIGTPTPERWPDVTNLPWYELVKPREVIPNHFRELFQKYVLLFSSLLFSAMVVRDATLTLVSFANCDRWLSPAALDLAEQLLAYDPAKRATATQALEAPYFTEEAPWAEAPTGYVFQCIHGHTDCSLSCRLSKLEGEWHELDSKRERAKKRRRTEGT